LRALFPDVATQEGTVERRKGPRGTARGMGRVYQRGRIWWVEYWRRGRQYRESAGSQDEAKAWKLPRKRLGEMQARRFVGPQEERVTFEDLERLYLQDYEVRGLRSKTTADLRARHLKVFFGEDRAVDIAPARIRAYQAARLKEKAQAGTVNRETAALHRMFCLAVKAGQLSTIPAFPERLDENPPRQGFFEHAEYLAIRAHLPAAYADVLDFCYWTGWRRREVTALRWDEVDLAGGLIRLSPQRSKTKAGRLLLLSPALREVLERRRAARREDCPLVFHYRQG
jgi:integrase